MGGASKTTFKRYRAVFDKFKEFAAKHRIRFWQEVNKRLLEEYGRSLNDEGYAPATLYLEINTLKQIVMWLIRASAKSLLLYGAGALIVGGAVGDPVQGLIESVHQGRAVFGHIVGEPLGLE